MATNVETKLVTSVVKFHRRRTSDTIVVKFVGSYSCDKCRSELQIQTELEKHKNNKHVTNLYGLQRVHK